MHVTRTSTPSASVRPDALKMIDIWYEAGDVEALRIYFDARRAAFLNEGSTSSRSMFALVEQDIAKLIEFERENGVGSFLKIDHPAVQRSIAGLNTLYNAASIANASNAQHKRAKIVNALAILEFRGDC